MNHANTKYMRCVRERPSIADRDENRDRGTRARPASTVHAIQPGRRTPEVSRRCQSGSGTVAVAATTAVPRGARRRHSRLPPAAAEAICESGQSSAGTNAHVARAIVLDSQLHAAVERPASTRSTDSAWLCFSTLDSASAATKYRTRPHASSTGTGHTSSRTGIGKDSTMAVIAAARSAHATGAYPPASSVSSAADRSRPRHARAPRLVGGRGRASRRARRDVPALAVRDPRRTRRSPAGPRRAAERATPRRSSACFWTSSIKR